MGDVGQWLVGWGWNGGDGSFRLGGGCGLMVNLGEGERTGEREGEEETFFYFVMFINYFFSFCIVYF